MSSVKIFTDGGARGNPGVGACAFVVYRDGVVIQKDSEYLGNTTNNVAEYTGVLIALKWIKDNRAVVDGKKIDFFLDSQLVVRQLSGRYKVKNKNLIELFLKIKDLQKLSGFEFTYNHIPREENAEADLLVNQTIDENL